jgi:hypothetical protein
MGPGWLKNVSSLQSGSWGQIGYHQEPFLTRSHHNNKDTLVPQCSLLHSQAVARWQLMLVSCEHKTAAHSCCVCLLHTCVMRSMVGR